MSTVPPEKDVLNLHPPIVAKHWLAHPLMGWFGGSAIILFICSSVRHLLFQSAAFDLGIFDQAVYLISQGLPPISSFLGFHYLGDHAAWSVYLLALLYRIYPSVYWLLAVQAICLALGVVPTWLLARQAGLTPALSEAIAIAYLLYPLIFNINLFDFHPEVMALPVILAAILAARLGQTIWFCAAVLFVLGCKAVLSLTVAAMGIWLLLFEQRRLCGAIALVAGVIWFLVTTQWIIPLFSGSEAAAVGRYDYLGDAVLDIAQNLFLKPGIVLSKVFSLDTLEYLALLLSPLIWGLSPKHLAPLIGAIPPITLNILSNSFAQRNLVHQYSLPILPFLLVAVISGLAAGNTWLRRPQWIVLWSFIGFIALAKYGYFGSRYLSHLDTWQATREAIAHIETNGGVLTDMQMSPHVTHRPIVYLIRPQTLESNLNDCDYVLLNLRHPWDDNFRRVRRLVNRIQKHPDFQLSYEQDEVYLFTRRGL
jgi:uncharacterized membrane protein